MKNRSKLLVGFVGGLLLYAAGPLRPALAENYHVLDSTVTPVAISTTPTKILSATNTQAVVYLFAASSGAATDTLIIGSNTSISTNTTTGNFRFLVNTVFPMNEYEGPLWAVVLGTTPVNVSVLRKR